MSRSVSESPTNSGESEGCLSFQLVLMKEPRERSLKYDMYPQISKGHDGREYYVMHYTYGSIHSSGKSHIKCFFDDRGENTEETRLTAKEKAVAFASQKYEELREKGYVSKKETKNIADKSVLEPGESIYLERKDPYSGEKSFLFFQRELSKPMITKIQGNEGDRGTIHTFMFSPTELTDYLHRVESIIEEHYKTNHKKKPKTMDAVMRMANIRHEFESDDDEDDLEDHEILPYERTKKRKKQRRN